MKKVTLETWHKNTDKLVPDFDCYYTEIRSTQKKSNAKKAPAKK